MDGNERQRLRSSFGSAAVAYREHRPDYAAEAVRWAVGPLSSRRVLDLGAGTGKLTASLVALGADVVAVEPDLDMLAQLRDELPAVDALPGSAEAIPLADAAVDVVVAGNALHWFDLDVAGPEINRVLASGGVLAGLWNVLDDRVEWVDGLSRATGSAAIGPRDRLSSWSAGGAFPDLGSLGGFGLPERAAFLHGQRRTADSLVATLGTRAGMLVMPEPERKAALVRVRAYLASRPETAGRSFELPLVTAVQRVQKHRSE